MPEKSMWWDTGVVGSDGENPYDQEEYRLLFMEMFTRSANEGPLHTSGSTYDVAGELAVTAGSGKVTVDTGRALVGGFPYRNPAAVDFTVAVPTGATRYDRVWVRADWTTKKVRLAYEQNPSEGVDDLVAHHTPGDHWDIPLAYVAAGTDGSITITDARQFCSGGISVKGDTIEKWSVGAINMTKRYHWELLPLHPVDADQLSWGTDPMGVFAPDNIETTYWARGIVYADYAQDMTFAIVGHGVTTGDYWMGLKVWISRNAFDWDEVSGEEAGIVSLTANKTTRNICALTLNPYQGELFIRARVTRYGNAPGDDGGAFVFDGVEVKYLADH